MAERLRRHLRSGLAADQPLVNPAYLALARDDAHTVGAYAVRERILAAVEPEAAHLLRRAMTFYAVLFEQWLDVAPEIDFGRCSSTANTRKQYNERYARNASWTGEACSGDTTPDCRAQTTVNWETQKSGRTGPAALLLWIVA